MNGILSCVYIVRGYCRIDFILYGVLLSVFFLLKFFFWLVGILL